MSAKRQRDAQPDAAPPAAAPAAPDAEPVAAESAAPAADSPCAETAAPAADAARAEAAALSAAAAEAATQAAALAALTEERERLLRQLAERDNQVKRFQRDQERDLQRLRGELALLFLPVLDDLERALAQPAGEAEAAQGEGLRLIAQRFQSALAACGLEVIPALGERFDPRVHEALLQLPGVDAEKGTVIQELQKGYRLGDLVIRPAKVAVAG